MLDAGREKLFHFDLDETLAGISNQDAVGALKGNITAKAGVRGIDEAREYLGRMVKENVITLDESRRIATLLEGYGKWR